jgi:hypothetical protein
MQLPLPHSLAVNFSMKETRRLPLSKRDGCLGYFISLYNTILLYFLRGENTKALQERSKF